MTAPVVVLTVAEARDLVRQLGRWPTAPLCGARIRVVYMDNAELQRLAKAVFADGEKLRRLGIVRP